MSLLDRAYNGIIRRIRYNLLPRGMRWKKWKKTCPDKAVITELGNDGLQVRVYPQDVVGQEIYMERVFEADSWNFVKHLLQPGMTVLDLGANFGQYTLLAAERVGETGVVHSFEPSERMFSELQFNVNLNKQNSICNLNHLAVSDERGTARLSKYETGAELYGSLGTSHRQNKEIVGYEEVGTIVLSEYLSECKVEHVDFIKIDIEGAELLALRGMKNLITSSDPPVIMFEMSEYSVNGFGYSTVDICDYLKGLDYQLALVAKNIVFDSTIRNSESHGDGENYVGVHSSQLESFKEKMLSRK